MQNYQTYYVIMSVADFENELASPELLKRVPISFDEDGEEIIPESPLTNKEAFDATRGLLYKYVVRVANEGAHEPEGDEVATDVICVIPQCGIKLIRECEKAITEKDLDHEVVYTEPEVNQFQKDGLFIPLNG